MTWIREPAVAGRFYPGDAAHLAREVEGYLKSETAPAPALAVVAPHAGYVFSGAIAGEVYARVEVPRTAVVLCPSHTGRGARRSLWASGAWRIPGGEVRVDAELAALLRDEAGLAEDREAHLQEHSLEVHLPFLRARNPEVRIVPVSLSALSLLECVALGEALAAVLRDWPGEALIVASTDFSHFLSADEARAQDELALERIQAVDPEGLYETVRRHDISMCGVIPVTVALSAVRAMGARAAQLVRYGHSGETSGDHDRVVGYGGLVVRRPD